MISPTIGHVVWFYPARSDIQQPLVDQPYPALICYVHTDNEINVAGFDSVGFPFAESNVQLIQENYPYPNTDCFAKWMPYQIQAAAK